MRTYFMNINGAKGSKNETAVLVIGPKDPSRDQKLECVNLVSKLVDAGWPVAANSSTAVGRLVQRVVRCTGGRFVELDRANAGSKPNTVPNIVFSPVAARRSYGLGLR